MDNYWEMQFEPHILARGKNYFEEGNVCRIYQFGNTVRATVKGTEDYNVEIDLSGGKPDFMLCTCPYAANNHCKHMAALLYAIDAGEYVFTEEKVNPHTIEPIEHVPVDLPWLEAIDQLPESIIRRITMQLADRDDRLKERLSFLYLQGTPEGMLNNWRADLQQLAFQAVNRHGVMEYEEADIFMLDLHNFLVEKLAMLMEANAIMDAYQMVWIVLETAMEQIYDEPDGSLQYLEGCCEDAWESIIGTASDCQKEQMLDIFWDYHKKIKWEYGVDGIEVDSFFLRLPWTKELHVKNLDRLANKLATSQDDGSNHATWEWIISEIIEKIGSTPDLFAINQPLNNHSAEIKPYCTVLLKDGREATIVEVCSEKDFLVDVGSTPNDWQTIPITIEEVEEVITSHAGLYSVDSYPNNNLSDEENENFRKRFCSGLGKVILIPEDAI